MRHIRFERRHRCSIPRSVACIFLDWCRARADAQKRAFATRDLLRAQENGGETEEPAARDATTAESSPESSPRDGGGVEDQHSEDFAASVPPPTPPPRPWANGHVLVRGRPGAGTTIRALDGTAGDGVVALGVPFHFESPLFKGTALLRLRDVPGFPRPEGRRDVL